MCVGAPGFEELVRVVGVLVAFEACPEVGFGWDEGWCSWVAFDADDEGVAFGAVCGLEHAG
jgi:hypothetical protein